MKEVIEKLAADIQQELIAVETQIEKLTMFRGIILTRHQALMDVLESSAMLEGIMKYKRKHETTNRRSRKDCCDDRQPAGAPCVSGGEDASESCAPVVPPAEQG